jgi:hypothetical protein
MPVSRRIAPAAQHRLLTGRRPKRSVAYPANVIATAAIALVAMMNNRANAVGKPARRPERLPQVGVAAAGERSASPQLGETGPSSAITAPSTQTRRVPLRLPIREATTDGLRKIPEPMIPPMTIMVAENSPRVRA